MKAKNLHWECPKCGNKVLFGEELVDSVNKSNGETGELVIKDKEMIINIKCSNIKCSNEWGFELGKISNG